MIHRSIRTFVAVTTGVALLLMIGTVQHSVDAASAAPTTPLNVHVVDQTDVTITLAWDPSSDPDGDLDMYLIHDSSYHYLGYSTTTAITLDRLTPGATYELTVTAHDWAGNQSAPSEIVTVTTAPSSDTEPPTAPANLNATGYANPFGDTVVLAWTASQDNVGVDHYVIAGTGPDFDKEDNWLGTFPTSYPWSQLQPEATYTFTIYAVDARGNSSEAVSVTITTPPTPPCSDADRLDGMC